MQLYLFGVNLICISTISHICEFSKLGQFGNHIREVLSLILFNIRSSVPTQHNNSSHAIKIEMNNICLLI